MLLRNSEDETIRRIAAGAIANLAMNGKTFFGWSSVGFFELYCLALCPSPDRYFVLLCAESNQELIMAHSGISLLAMTAAEAEDPQTLRMVAGAIANLCGNGMLICFYSVVFIIFSNWC